MIIGPNYFYKKHHQKYEVLILDLTKLTPHNKRIVSFFNNPKDYRSYPLSVDMYRKEWFLW